MGKRRKKPPQPPAGPPTPVDPADIPLSDDEQRFIEEYIIDRNASRAYRIAFPGTSYHNARAGGSNMVARPNVAREIAAIRREQGIRCRVSADAVINELGRIALSDVADLFDPITNNLRHPRHIPYDLRKAIASVKVSRSRRSVTRNGKTKTTVTDSFVEYKLWNKLDALAKLGNRLGLNTEITPVEALLQMLPRPLAVQVRAALLAPTAQAPSTNGKALTESNGKH